MVSNILTNTERFEKQLQLLSSLNRLFQTDEIDLVLLNEAPTRFAHSILKDGKLLFCRDFKVLVNFSEYIRQMYFDFIYYRDCFDEVFLKGIGYCG